MRIGRHTQVQNLRFAVHISPRREPAQAAGCKLTAKGFRISNGGQRAPAKVRRDTGGAGENMSWDQIEGKWKQFTG
jgi:hypothetical protein